MQAALLPATDHEAALKGLEISHSPQARWLVPYSLFAERGSDRDRELATPLQCGPPAPVSWLSAPEVFLPALAACHPAQQGEGGEVVPAQSLADVLPEHAVEVGQELVGQSRAGVADRSYLLQVLLILELWQRENHVEAMA